MVLRLLCVVLVSAIVIFFSQAPAFAQLLPDKLEVTLEPGETVCESKQLIIPEVIPQADVLFAFDLTGSMGDVIDLAKVAAADIMYDLDTLIEDANYGVCSFMDYQGSFTSCGYSDTYGGGSDYPYLLNQPLTDDRTAVKNAINALSLGSGMDGPEDYTRVIWESFSDPNIIWRAGSKKIIVIFGDNVPHDCNLNEGVPDKTGIWTTGVDPGRDGIALTSDDPDLQNSLRDMALNEVTLLTVWSSSFSSEYWDYWTSLTGGSHYVIDNVDEIPAALVELIGCASELQSVTLQTSVGYEGWLISVDPPEYTNVVPPVTLDFDICIRPPVGTLVGTHTFQVYAACFGSQDVTINLFGIILTYPPDDSVAYLTPTFRWLAALGTDEVYVIDFLVQPGGRTYTTEILTKPYWKLPHEYWIAVPSESQIYWRVRGADLDQKPIIVLESEPWSITKY